METYDGTIPPAQYAGRWILEQLNYQVTPEQADIFVAKLAELTEAAIARKVASNPMWIEDLPIGVYTARKIHWAAEAAGIVIEGKWKHQFTVYVSTDSCVTEISS